MADLSVLRWMRENPAQVGRWCGFDRLTDELHGKWMRDMITGADDMTLLAHRGEGLQDDLPLRVTDGHGGGLGATHHDALHECLTADGGLFHFATLIFTHSFSSFLSENYPTEAIPYWAMVSWI